MVDVGSKQHNSLNFAVSMTLFTVFALFLTLVLLMGASSVGNIAASADERFSERTPLLYLSQRIRSFDSSDSIKITQIDGVSALVLSGSYFDSLSGTGGSTEIYIYHWDGFLTELYTFDGEAPNLRIGTSLFAAESLAFDVILNSLIKVTVGDNSIYVNLYSGVGI